MAPDSPDPAPLFVDDGGVGDPPVLFLHSLAGDSSQWAAQLEHLRPRHRAAAVDLPGHGRSPPAEAADYSVDTYAAAVASLADALRLECFVLVGHSMGASVAAACAAARPGRVAGLVLVDGAFAREEPTNEEVRWLAELEQPDLYEARIEGHWSAILGGSVPDVRERVMAVLRSTPPETVVGSFRELVRHDPIPLVRAYPGPTLCILGDIGDLPAAPHRHVEGLEHHLIRGTGHWLQLDRPVEVNALLDAFLARDDLLCA